MSVTLRGVGVEATGLGFRYHGLASASLDNVDFRVAPGGALLVVGPSGSGKSTLVKLLAGVMDPEEDGEVQGELLIGETRWQERERLVGVVLQQPDDQTILHTVGDDVAFGLENTGVPRSQMGDRIRRALEMVGLDLPLTHSTEALSGGQRQRLALAGAIAMQPELIVLDEPLQALDADGKQQVLAAIRTLREETGVTLVVIDHDPLPWAGICSEVLAISQGTSDGPWPVDEAPISWQRKVRRPARALAKNQAVVLQTSELRVGRSEVALPGVHDIELKSGEIVAITGPNGSGKTTLALTLAGILAPQAGAITTPASPHTMSSSALSKQLSFVPQNPAHHQVGATVAEDIATTLIAQGLNHQERQSRLSGVISEFRLDGLLERHPASLSGGEARRVALAGAMVADPPVVILDEPTQSLDREAWQQLVDMVLRRANQGAAVIVVTHDQQLIDALGAREYRMPRTDGSVQITPPSKAPRWLRQSNPLALLGAAFAIGVGLLASLDVVSSAVALGLILGLLVVARAVTWNSVVRLSPVVLAAVFAAITIAFYGQTAGEVLWSWGIARVSEGSLELAVATFLRILAIATPAVVLFSHVEATRLADALAQLMRLPSRFVIGALAAIRLVQVLGRDYQQLQAARRSRGIGDRPLWKRVGPDALGLLVIALRRAAILAIAMECRGFGRDTPRTFYRQSEWARADTLIVVVGALIATVSLAVAWQAGTLSP